MSSATRVAQSGGRDARSTGGAQAPGAAPVARRARSGSAQRRDPRADRYNLSGARAGEAVKASRLRNRDLALAAVPDPHATNPGERVVAQVNRRVDILEKELSERNITPSEYQTGRVAQAVLELGTGARLGSGGWNPFTSRDQTQARDQRMVRALETAQQVRAMRGDIERAIGAVGARFLAAILAEGVTYAEYAAARGKTGERAVKQVAGHFRFLLTGLDEAFAAEGRSSPIRGERAASVEDEETDAAGCLVPAGQGYRLGDDPAARWQPRGKSRAAQEASRKLGARR